MTGYKRIGCEFNAKPPNPQSDLFHCKMGFKQVGSAKLIDRGKNVRYFAYEL